MSESKHITHQFLEVVKLSESPVDRALVPVLLAIGIFYMGVQGLERDWGELVFFAFGVVLLLALATLKPLRERVLGQPLNRRHLLYIAFYWMYSVVWLNVLRLMAQTPTTGKHSEQFYFLLILLVQFSFMGLRALAILTPFFHRRFITRIPIWEQIIVAINEMVAAGLLALVGAGILVHLLQPDVFTTRVDITYTAGLSAIVVIYYLGMQLMWIQGWNDWLSQNVVWVRLARVFAPLALVVTTLIIARRFAERAEPRSANLVSDARTDLAVLALASVIWLVILVVTILVYTSGRGLRQRFLPDLLLDRLPPRVANGLRSISDMDMLLIMGLLLTLIPAYLFLLGDTGGLIGTLQGQILQRGSALIETSEQALAILFAAPFYLVAVALLSLYALVFSRPTISAHDRDELVEKLPVGFLIVLIITLYLFAVPFSQVLTEGRLPQLPQDLGRILAFNVLIPLVLLYLHYFLLVRLPYGRGQSRWRDNQNTYLTRELNDIERRIENLNREIQQLDRAWMDERLSSSSANLNARFETLYRYMQLNSLRDDLNMQRLQNIALRQQLTEVSEAPVSIAVARLPIRVVSLGIPLLLLIQIYQWAVLNDGLRQVINNPNITVFEFFRIILRQTQF